MAFRIQSVGLGRSAIVQPCCSASPAPHRNQLPVIKGEDWSWSMASCTSYPGFAASRPCHPANTPRESRADCLWRILPKTQFRLQLAIASPGSKQRECYSAKVRNSLFIISCHFPPILQQIQDNQKRIKQRDNLHKALYLSQLCASSRRENTDFWAKHQVNTELLTVLPLWKETTLIHKNKKAL